MQHRFTPHYTLWQCLNNDEPGFFTFYTSHGILTDHVAEQTPCDQVFAYCKQNPFSSFANVLRHKKNLLEKVLSDELRFGMFEWPGEAEVDEELVPTLSERYKFLSHLENKKMRQKTTYEILQHDEIVQQNPGETKLNINLDLNYLEGILKPSFFVVKAPVNANISNVRVEYKQDDIQVREGKIVIFETPKVVSLDAGHNHSARYDDQQLFLIQAPTKWPVGERAILEKLFSLFHRNSEMQVLHDLLKSESSATDEHSSISDENLSMSSEAKQGSSSAKQGAYTVVGEETELHSDPTNKQEEDNASQEINTEASSTGSDSGSKTGTNQTSETNSTKANYQLQPSTAKGSTISVTTSSQPSTAKGSTISVTTSFQTETGKKPNTSQNISFHGASITDTLDSPSNTPNSTDNWMKPESGQDSLNSSLDEESEDESLKSSEDGSVSSPSETDVTKTKGKTEPTQAAAVQNGGMLYDHNKLEALSALLPYMQGLADKKFKITLELGSTESLKKFKVEIELLGVRQIKTE